MVEVVQDVMETVKGARQARGVPLQDRGQGASGAERCLVQPRSLRVLYCSPTAGLFGAERSLLSLLIQLDRRVVEPMVLLPSEGELAQAVRALGIPVIVNADCVPSVSVPMVCAAAHVIRLAKILRGQRIDVFHLNLWFPPMDLAVLSAAARLAGSAFVIHIRNNMKRSTDYLDPCDRFCFAGADRLICVTEFVRRALVTHTPGKRFNLDRARTSVIGRGYVVGRPLPSAAGVERLRVSLQVPTGAPVVGMVAALHPIKNQELFLQAAALVRDRLPSARFLVVGRPYDGSDIGYVDRLQRLVATLGLSREVQFLGYRQDVPALLQLIDIIVLPSRSEALGGILVEAMMAGKPVVAANVDGIPEVVLDREVGFLIDGYEPAPYAEHIIHLLMNRTLARAMGERGRVLAAERFDAARTARQVEAVYAAIRKLSLARRMRNAGIAVGLRVVRRWL